MNEKKILRATVLNLIAEISPMARDFVEDVFDNIVILDFQNDANINGIFLNVEIDELSVYYANYSDDSSLSLLNKIAAKINNLGVEKKEICFNIQGNNKNIIKLVQSYGFCLDMEGYILKHSDPVTRNALGDIKLGEVEQFISEDFINLFESAYEQLNLENGWDVRSYSKHSENFYKRIKLLHEEKAMNSFYLQGDLIGCYILSGDYISDILVHPDYQNKGYGSLILNHCINFMREEKGVNDIYLRVTESNIRAKQLYERNGFVMISHFAEHTYKG